MEGVQTDSSRVNMAVALPTGVVLIPPRSPTLPIRVEFSYPGVHTRVYAIACGVLRIACMNLIKRGISMQKVWVFH